MTIDKRIVLNPRTYSHSRSPKVESGIFAIGVDRRVNDIDWGILRFQKLYFYADGTNGLEKSTLREKFRVAGPDCSRPLDHAIPEHSQVLN